MKIIIQSGCAFQSGACYDQEDYFGKFGDIKPLQKCVQKGKNPFDTSNRHSSKSFTFRENPTCQRLKLRTNEVTCKNSANGFYLW